MSQEEFAKASRIYSLVHGMTLSHPDTKQGQQNRKRKYLFLFYHRAGCGFSPSETVTA